MYDWESETIQKKIQMAEMGFAEWGDIKEKYNLECRYSIFFDLIEAEEYRGEFIEWLPEFAKKKGFKKTLIFSNKLKLSDFDSCFYDNIIILPFMDNIFSFYRMSRFSRFIYVLSLEMPFGNKNMFGHNGITFREWLRNWG